MHWQTVPGPVQLSHLHRVVNYPYRGNNAATLAPDVRTASGREIFFFFKTEARVLFA